MTYTDYFESIVREMDELMSHFSHTKKDIGYGYRRTFQNKHRVDMIDYGKTWEVIFRVGRGAWLVKKHPVLYSLFDEVLTVIAKIHITDEDFLQQKDIAMLLEVISDLTGWAKMNEM